MEYLATGKRCRVRLPLLYSLQTSGLLVTAPIPPPMASGAVEKEPMEASN
jgi:hypothetical protein